MFPTKDGIFNAWDDLFAPTRPLDAQTAKALDYEERMARAMQAARQAQDAVDRARQDLEREREVERTAEEFHRARYGGW